MLSLFTIVSFLCISTVQAMDGNSPAENTNDSYPTGDSVKKMLQQCKLSTLQQKVTHYNNLSDATKAEESVACSLHGVFNAYINALNYRRALITANTDIKVIREQDESINVLLNSMRRLMTQIDISREAVKLITDDMIKTPPAPDWYRCFVQPMDGNTQSQCVNMSLNMQPQNPFIMQQNSQVNMQSQFNPFMNVQHVQQKPIEHSSNAPSVFIPVGVQQVPGLQNQTSSQPPMSVSEVSSNAPAVDKSKDNPAPSSVTTAQKAPNGNGSKVVKPTPKPKRPGGR